MSFPRYERYKDSGVEWLGEVPEHWSIRRMKTLFEIKKRIAGETGYDILSITQSGIKIKDIESNEGQLAMDYAKYQLVYPGDFAMNHMDLLTGYVDISKVEGVTSPDYRVFGIRKGSLCHPSYFLHLFQTAYHQEIFYAFGQGASQFGRWRLPTEAFNEFALPYPPLSEQTLIGEFLDREAGRIDALIEEQWLLIALLKEKREAVVSRAVTKGLNPNARLKDSGVDLLGNVPAQWVPMTVTRIIERIEQGWSPDCFARQADTEEWGVVKSGCVNRGVFAETQNKALPAELDPNPEYEIKPGDVLMSRASGSPELVGSTALVTETRPRLMLSDKIFRICLEESISKEFFVALFNSQVMRSQIERAISGAGGLANNLPQSALKSFWFALPPRHEQDLIALYIARQTGEIDALVKEAELAISFLEERRTSTLSAAITGKIDLRAYAAKPLATATKYSSGFAHQLLAAEILDRCNSQRMGRIKLQKLIHLCEYHGQVSEIQGDYSRKAAGPFDARAMAGISKNLKKQKWFEEVKEGERYVYRPLEKRGEHKKYLSHWQTEMPRIDEVLSLLGNFRTRECEIISTLYAAWNDLLIDGGPTDDAAILHEASSAERWHKSKEQIAPERWTKALHWMKEKGLVPVGYGKHTRHTAGQIGPTTEEAHEPA